MGAHFVQNSLLFPHLLVGVVASARQALHTHRDPREKKGGEWRGGGRRVEGRSESGREE